MTFFFSLSNIVDTEIFIQDRFFPNGQILVNLRIRKLPTYTETNLDQRAIKNGIENVSAANYNFICHKKKSIKVNFSLDST